MGNAANDQMRRVIARLRKMGVTVHEQPGCYDMDWPAPHIAEDGEVTIENGATTTNNPAIARAAIDMIDRARGYAFRSQEHPTVPITVPAGHTMTLTWHDDDGEVSSAEEYTLHDDYVSSVLTELDGTATATYNYSLDLTPDVPEVKWCIVIIDMMTDEATVEGPFDDREVADVKAFRLGVDLNRNKGDDQGWLVYVSRFFAPGEAE